MSVKSGLCPEPGGLYRVVGQILLAIVLSMVVWTTQEAFAEDRVFDINIPASDAATALNKLAEQTGAIMLFPYDEAEARKSNPVVGQFSLQRALDLLLSDTGLSGGLSEKQVIQVSVVETGHSDDEEGDMTPKERKGIGKSIAAFIGAVFVASPATAQDNDLPFEEIVVRGYKSSLDSAIETRRNRNEFVEAVAAEDLGKLPDLSIAESISRLPGITSARIRGDSSEISIRGLGGRFNNTLLNGREQTTPTNSRRVEFDQYPSELLTGAVVYKTPTPSLTEGGLGGTINLQTVRPLDYNGPQFVISLRGSLSDLSDDNPDASGSGYRASASYIGQFANDTVGVAVGFARLDRPIAGSSVANWGYANPAADLDGDGELDAASWGAGIDVRGGESTRDGAIAVVQWAPSETVDIQWDTYYSVFDNVEDQRSVWITGTSDPVWSNIFTDVTIETNAVLGATISPTAPWGLGVRTVNSRPETEDDIFTTGLNASFQVTDSFSLIADVSFSESNRDSQFFAVSARPYDISGATPVLESNLVYTFDVTQGDVSDIWLNQDLTDTTTNLVDSMEVWKTDNKDELVSGRLDGAFDLSSGFFTSVGLGVEIKNREKTFERSAFLPFIAPTEIPSGMSFEVSVPGGSEFSSVIPFLGMNTLAVADALFPPVDLQITESIAPSNWIISEDVTAGYIQADFGNEAGERGFSGNIGVRFVRTEIESVSARLENGVLVDNAHSVSNDYSDTLPSLNLSYWFDDDQRVRFAVGKVMARPPLDDLGSGVARWGIDDFGGNPLLEPFRADQFDLAYERYFADAGGALSIGVFYKDLDTFIVESQVPNEVGGTFTQPFNGTGGKIKGAEFALIRSLDFLPAPFNGLGLNVNYTYLDSDVEWNTPWSVVSFTLPGLSEDVANAIIWYERGGFSTRLSYRYRGAFVSSGANADGDVYARSEDLLDFEASYLFENGTAVDGLRLMFQVNNINDTPFRTFYEFQARRGQYELYGWTIYAGLQYQF